MALHEKPRLTMCSRVFMVVIGVLYIIYEVYATEDVFIAELMVESNVTLEAKVLQSVLNSTVLQVTASGDGPHNVTLLHNELVAECLIVGDDTSCNCSKGYIWSNDVCYNFNCCRETTCKANVSHIVPLCIAKIQVRLNGSVALKTLPWDTITINPKVKSAFERLNGFENLNITTTSGNMSDFEAAVSVKFPTSKLQEVVSQLETDINAVVKVDTYGLVTIESPGTMVCYESSPTLTCTFDEKTDSAGWNMSRKHERFELNTGSVVRLNHSCFTAEYKSCVAVTLQLVTGIWEGIYECGFTLGSVRHTAKTQLTVALLPDVINLKIDPLAGDCSQGTETVDVTVTATILDSKESFEVFWLYRGAEKDKLQNKTDGDNLVYTFIAALSCVQSDDAQSINVTFRNSLNQEKSAQVDVPVIYDGAKFCPEEITNGEIWPKTPKGNTVINRTCPEGRVGYKSRTCKDTTWQEVFSDCVNEELNKVSDAADNFLKGLGATQEVAMDIFEGLTNTSTSDSDSDSDSDPGDSMADITASVNVLNVMASASLNVVLEEAVLPNLVKAASNMLNKTWAGVNESVVQSVSSSYLQSVEDLVKNIKVNQSNGINSQNLDLKFCSSGDCQMSVFDVEVNLNKSGGIMKTVAVKNLMTKLRNNFRNTRPLPTSIVLSATLEQNNDSSLNITLAFPQDELNSSERFCVFWNTTEHDWSDEGCFLDTSNSNRTICICNHLTSFSVLMSKGDVSTDVLDMITNVGLGVSICSLLIFLIIESLVWSAVVKSNLSHFRHTALVNIAMFLLLADCCFLASSEPTSIGETWCLVLTMCKHLFFLAMFSWMMCMSVMLVHQLIFVFSPLRKRVFMFLSSIVGYVCPILIVGSSYVYCKYTEKDYYDKKTCWLVFERLLEGSIHAFLLPVGTVILTNLFSMVVVILTLVKSSVPDGGKTDDKDTAKSILKVVVFLTPVFGVTWIIGFALLMLDSGTPMHNIANYAFTILNSFQGFFILVTGCFAEQKVREEVIKLITAKSKGKNESIKNSTSTTYTKDK